MTESQLRLVVTRGGEPTPEQAAALTLALSVARRSAPKSDAPSRWLRAALHEGVGGRPITSEQGTPSI